MWRVATANPANRESTKSPSITHCEIHTFSLTFSLIATFRFGLLLKSFTNSWEDRWCTTIRTTNARSDKKESE